MISLSFHSIWPLDNSGFNIAGRQKKAKILFCLTLALSLISGWFVFIGSAAAGSTIVVTTTSDSIASDGLCSLREAIIAANTDSAFNGCPAGSGNDTIMIDPALSTPTIFLLTLTGAGEDSGLTGDLDITGSIVNTLAITGADLDNTIIDGNGTDRVLDIQPGARATISGVTIRNGNPGFGNDGGGIALRTTGRLTLDNSRVFTNTAASGGGVHVLGGLTLNNSAIEANYGGGVHNNGGLLDFNNAQVISNTHGYGVHNEGQGFLLFDGGTVSGNREGGILNDSSDATLTNLNIIYNTTGGGVHNKALSAQSPGDMTLSNSSIMSNTNDTGGGLLNNGPGTDAIVENSRFSFNTATPGNGGGIKNGGTLILKNSLLDHNQARSGGGIDNGGFSLDMTNVTISNNMVDDNGGGLHNRTSASLENVTVIGNSASGMDTGGNIYVDGDSAQLSLRNSIVAYAGAGGNCVNNMGALNSLGHNLDSETSCGFTAAGDISSSDPMLGPLQDNGGPTFTHALLPGSPAIDNGDDNNCPTNDQRGISRPQGGGCDIGAYEFAETADLSIGKIRLSPAFVDAGDAVSFTITISNAGPTSPVTAIVVDSWTPVSAVVAASAPGCSINLAGGTITCTQSNLGIESAVVPNPSIILTTHPTYSGTLSNSASVNVGGGITDLEPDNDNTGSVLTTIIAPPSYGVDLSPNQALTGLPGETVTYTLQITNLGTVADTFDLDVSGNSWTTNLSTSSVMLAAGASTSFEAWVAIPGGAGANDDDSVSIEATSQGDNSKSDTAVLTTSVPPIYGVNLPTSDTRIGMAGETVTYTVQISNTGNVADTFDLEATGNVWTTTLSHLSIVVAAGKSATFTVTVDIPAGASIYDSDSVSITAKSQHDGSKQDTVVLMTSLQDLPFKIYLPSIKSI